MNTKTPNKAGYDTEDKALAPADIFDLLADDRRRYLIYYLSQQVGGVLLGEITEQIAIWEDDPTSEQYERILTGLYHIQIPKLAKASLITFDSESETITGTETIDQVMPYLELAKTEDIH